MEEKKNNGLASLIIVIFAIIGVACATLILFKKFKERKLIKDNDEFDDLDDDDYCDCECCCCEEDLEEAAEEEAEEEEKEEDAE